MAERFGKSKAFGVGLGLLPFVYNPILAWSRAEYGVWRTTRHHGGTCRSRRKAGRRGC